MTAASLITLRETLETSLVVGIMLATLERLDERRLKPQVWWGVASGIVASILLATLFQYFAFSLSGNAEAIYEGVMMLLAAGLLTSMILWMMRQKHKVRSQIEGSVVRTSAAYGAAGIFALAFLSTLREGVETVIFLQAAFLQAQSGLHAHFLGALLGIGFALIVSLLVFRRIATLSLKHFFSITATLLILFAAGLFRHAVAEFQEVGLLPPLIEHVWNTSVLLSEEGLLGSILTSVFGYTPNPSLLELLAYIAYFIGISVIVRRLPNSSRSAGL